MCQPVCVCDYLGKSEKESIALGYDVLKGNYINPCFSADYLLTTWGLKRSLDVLFLLTNFQNYLHYITLNETLLFLDFFSFFPVSIIVGSDWEKTSQVGCCCFDDIFLFLSNFDCFNFGAADFLERIENFGRRDDVDCRTDCCLINCCPSSRLPTKDWHCEIGTAGMIDFNLVAMVNRRQSSSSIR